ncbi:MAG TPA: S8 family serine peptidase [Phycisphaerales bacterium]|nr:S8 family serine peptidase [Phycisphaerales bacterium]
MAYRSLGAALATLMLCAGSAISTAAINADPNAPRLDLRGHAFNPALDVLSGAQFSAARHVIILDGPLTPAREKQLTDAGVQLGSYLPTNAFIAVLSNTTPAQLRALGFVLWAGEYQRAWKIDAALVAGAHGRPFETPLRREMADAGLVAAHVWLFDDEPSDPVRDALIKLPNTQVVSIDHVGRTACLNIIMPAADVHRLADLPGVQFAEHQPEFTPRGGNSETRWIVQTNVTNETPLYNIGVTGAGQIIGLIDGGIGVSHCSFFDAVNPIGPNHRKILAYNAASQFADSHGTHIAGTLAGDNGVFDNTRGIAYGAKLVFNQWPSPNEQSQIQRHSLHYSQGAAIHSNSWGDSVSTAYDSACRGLDSFQHDFDDNLIFFAVTNSNTTVRNPENAKNVLAVAGSGSAGAQQQVCVGGWAPTADGRRKPEITAPGCAISSSGTTGCGTAQQTGTSMACPAAAAAATLARQYFMGGYYPTGTPTPGNAFTPSGALIKAVVANSAQDMTGNPGYPSDREGWGRVTIANVLGFAPDQRKLLLSDVRNANPAALTTGQTSEITFHVGPCESVLKATLAYHDAPALANAASAPVNNLDLELIDPEGNVYRGNFFANGSSVAGGTADALNNLEQVYVTSPAVGRWTARVIATAVNDGPQGFALVVAGPVDQNACGSADFNCDGDTGTDQDIEAFFAALGGTGPGDADFNRDGDTGTDQDIEAFFRVLGGNPC